jgi:hypothetical protein
MKKPREVIQPRWSVYLFRRKAERVPFSVTGRNAEQALERAMYGQTERLNVETSRESKQCPSTV